MQPCLFLQLSKFDFNTFSPFTPARVGEADSRHHRVLLQAAGGGRSSSAAHGPVHRRNVCQGPDGGGKTVSKSEEMSDENLSVFYPDFLFDKAKKIMIQLDKSYRHNACIIQGFNITI